MITDERLLSNYLAGSMSAFEELYRRNRPRVLSLARKHLDSDLGAEEVVQSVFRKFHKVRERFDPRFSVQMILFVITRQRIVKTLKRMGALDREKWFVENETIAPPVPFNQDFQSELNRQSAEMNPEKMEELKERFFDGLEMEEVGAHVGGKLPNGFWREDWHLFNRPTDRQEIAVDASTRLMVQSDLYPPTPQIIFRVLLYYILGGALAISVCPQFEFHIFDWEGLGWLLDKMGPSVRMITGAFFFETVALWAVGLCLSPEQLIAVSSRRATFILSLLVLALVFFLFLTESSWSWSAFLWLTGAVAAALTQANLLFPISEI